MCHQDLPEFRQNHERMQVRSLMSDAIETVTFKIE